MAAHGGRVGPKGTKNKAQDPVVREGVLKKLSKRGDPFLFSRIFPTGDIFPSSTSTSTCKSHAGDSCQAQFKFSIHSFFFVFCLDDNTFISDAEG